MAVAESCRRHRDRPSASRVDAANEILEQLDVFQESIRVIDTYDESLLTLIDGEPMEDSKISSQHGPIENRGAVRGESKPRDEQITRARRRLVAKVHSITPGEVPGWHHLVIRNYRLHCCRQQSTWQAAAREIVLVQLHFNRKTVAVRGNSSRHLLQETRAPGPFVADHKHVTCGPLSRRHRLDSTKDLGASRPK